MIDVYKTFAFFSDHDQGAPRLIDTILHEGHWWLVGTWLQSNGTGERTPETLVLLDALPHQEIEGKPYRFVLSNAIPRAVLRGKAREGYVVARYPMPGSNQGCGATDQRLPLKKLN